MRIIQNRLIWFIVSAVLIIPGIVFLSIWHLKLGLDFTGGTLLEYQFVKIQKVSTQDVRSAIGPLNLKDVSIANSSDNSVIIKTQPINQDKANEIKDALGKKFGETAETRLETIGPTVSKELTNKAILTVIIASIMIILYITFAFRKVPKPASSWRFGIVAVVALIHDVLFVAGVFSILGILRGIEIDSLFITAILTVMGFSVHDTIVIFDRLRENLRKYPQDSFEEVANASVAQSMTRSINTSMTVALVLASLVLFGGESIKYFVLALLIGIIIGTYSSIFFATPLLVVWQNLIDRRRKTKVEA